MKNDDKTLGTLLARTLIVLCMVPLSGCFTAYGPRTNPCTRDPENTAVRLCTPEEMKASTDWQNKINKGMNR
jgi:hypothetical protein